MLARILLAVVCLAVSGLAQTAVQISDVPITQTTEERYYRDASGNTEYICSALATQSLTSVWGRSSAAGSQQNVPTALGQGTLTQIVDSSNTSTVTTSVAHGYSVGQWITVTGATGDTDLNGTYVIASVPSSTTFTFATANVTDATYNEATLKFSSVAPRTNVNVWSVRKLYYTGTSIDRSVPAQGSQAMNKACDSRTTYF